MPCTLISRVLDHTAVAPLRVPCPQVPVGSVSTQDTEHRVAMGHTYLEKSEGICSTLLTGTQVATFEPRPQPTRTGTCVGPGQGAESVNISCLEQAAAPPPPRPHTCAVLPLTGSLFICLMNYLSTAPPSPLVSPPPGPRLHDLLNTAQPCGCHPRVLGAALGHTAQLLPLPTTCFAPSFPDPWGWE